MPDFGLDAATVRALLGLAGSTILDDTTVQTILNKILNIDANTIKHSTTNNAGDILASTGTKYDRFARGTSSQVLAMNGTGTGLVWVTLAGGGNVLSGASNTYGDFDQVFRSGRIDLRNPANTFSYSLVGAAITAARNLNLPLLTADDTVVVLALAQTLTNKTLIAPIISSIVNTGTLTLPTTTDTLVGRATTDTLLNKTLTTPTIASILNTGTITLPTTSDTLVGRATTDTLTNKTMATASNTLSGLVQEPVFPGKRTGMAQTAGNTMHFQGMLDQHTLAGTVSAVYDTTEGQTTNFATSSSGVNIGIVSPTVGIGVGRRLFPMRVKIRWKIDNTTSVRRYFGFTSATALPISAVPLAATDSGFIVGFTETGAGSTNYTIFHNDGATSVTTDNLSTIVAKDALYHTTEISWTAAGNCIVSFDGVLTTISADLPSTNSNLFFNAVAQTSAAVTRNLSIAGVWIEAGR